MSIFVTDAFAAELQANPQPYLSAFLYTNVSMPARRLF